MDAPVEDGFRSGVGLSVVVSTWCTSAQRAQYPLIKEYTLNHTQDPFIIYGVFLILRIGLFGWSCAAACSCAHVAVASMLKKQALLVRATTAQKTGPLS